MSDTCPHTCTLAGTGLEAATAGQPAYFTIVARDVHGAPRRAGGEWFRVELRQCTPAAGGSSPTPHSTPSPRAPGIDSPQSAPAGPAPGSRDGRIAVAVHDHQDGTYTASYMATAAGQYELTVRLVPPTPPPTALIAARHAAAAAPAPAVVVAGSAGASQHVLSAAAPPPTSDPAVEPSPSAEPWRAPSPIRVGSDVYMVRVLPAAAHGLRACAPAVSAVSASVFGPVHISVIDAFGNALPGGCPALRVMVGACTPLAPPPHTLGLPQQERDPHRQQCQPRDILASSTAGGQNRTYGTLRWPQPRGPVGLDPRAVEDPQEGPHPEGEYRGLGVGEGLPLVTCEVVPAPTARGGDAPSALWDEQLGVTPCTAAADAAAASAPGVRPADTPGVAAAGAEEAVTRLWLRVAGPPSHVRLLIGSAGMQPACLDLTLTGSPVALHATCGVAVAAPGVVFGPIQVCAVDRAGHSTDPPGFGTRLRLSAESELGCAAVDALGKGSRAGGESGGCGDTRDRGAAEFVCGGSAVGATPSGCKCSIEEVRLSSDGASGSGGGQRGGQRGGSGGGGSVVALVWVRLSGPPGHVCLSVLDEESRLSTRVPMRIYLSGPPYAFRVIAPAGSPHAASAHGRGELVGQPTDAQGEPSGGQGETRGCGEAGASVACEVLCSATAGELLCPLHIEIVDCNGTLITGLPVDPQLHFEPGEGAGAAAGGAVHQDEAVGHGCAGSTAGPCANDTQGCILGSGGGGGEDAVGGAACLSTACRIELVRSRWLCDASTGAKRAFELTARLHARSGLHTLLLTDELGLITRPAPVRVMLLPAGTDSRCCELAPRDFYLAALAAGELRQITITCRDAYGNAAPTGRDRIEIALDPISSPGEASGARLAAARLLSECTPHEGGQYRVRFGVTRAGTYRVRLLCNGALIPIFPPAGGAAADPALRVVAAPPCSLELIDVTCEASRTSAACLAPADGSAGVNGGSAGVNGGSSGVDGGSAGADGGTSRGEPVRLPVGQVLALRLRLVDAFGNERQASAPCDDAPAAASIPMSLTARLQQLHGAPVACAAGAGSPPPLTELTASGSGVQQWHAAKPPALADTDRRPASLALLRVEWRLRTGGDGWLEVRVAVGGEAGPVLLRLSLAVGGRDGPPLEGALPLHLQPGKPAAACCELRVPGAAHAGSAGGPLAAEADVPSMIAGPAGGALLLHLLDSWGNKLQAPGTEKLVSVRLLPIAAAPYRTGSDDSGGAGEGGPGLRAWAQAAPHSLGGVRLAFGAHRAGRYEVHVCVGGQHVPGSPVRVRVDAAPPHRLAARPPLQPAASGALYGPVEVWCLDEFGNVVDAEAVQPELCDPAHLTAPLSRQSRGDLAASSRGGPPPARPASAGIGSKLAVRAVVIRETGLPDQRLQDECGPSLGGGAAGVPGGGGRGGTSRVRERLSRRISQGSSAADASTPAVEAEVVRLVSTGGGRARLFLRLSGRVGPCLLGVCDRRGRVAGCVLSLTLAAGAPYALCASYYAAGIVHGQAFGPISVTLVDASGNQLPAADLPLHVSARLLPSPRESQLVSMPADERPQPGSGAADRGWVSTGTAVGAGSGIPAEVHGRHDLVREGAHCGECAEALAASSAGSGEAAGRVAPPRRRGSRLATELAAARAWDEKISPRDDEAVVAHLRAGGPAAAASGALALACRVMAREARPNGCGARGVAVLHLQVDEAEGGATGLIQLRIACQAAEAAGSGAGGSREADGAARADSKASPLPACLNLQLSKGLLFYSENPFVSRALRTRGWCEVGSPAEAPFVHLIWTIRSADIDFGRLQRGQLCNHFETNQMTNKVGIAQTLHDACRWQAHCDPRTFFPRSYDLASEEQLAAFLRDFELTAAGAVLRLIVEEMGAAAQRANSSGSHRSAGVSPSACLATATLAGVSLPLVRAALDVVRAALHNSGSAGGVDSPYRVPSSASALIPEMIRIASSGAAAPPAGEGLGAGVGWADGGGQGGAPPPQDALGERNGLRLEAAEALSELHRSNPQSGVDGTRNVWLSKPSYGSKGIGMRLFNDGVARAIAESRAQRVVQKYIERPLLLRGHKFDMRCWALVVDWAPLHVWMYDDCLLRFCAEPFSLVDLTNKFAHITNVSVQRTYDPQHGACSVPSSGGGELASASLACRAAGHLGSVSGCVGRVRSSSAGRARHPQAESAAAAPRRPASAQPAEPARSEVCAALWDAARLREELASLGMPGAWDGHILPALRRVTAATMRSAQERAEPRRGSFEVYGLDFVLDEALEPWLIEVNESPNLSAHGSELKARMLPVMLEQLVALLVDEAEARPDRAPRREGAAVGGWTLIHGEAPDTAVDALPSLDALTLDVVGTKAPLHRATAPER